MCVFWYVRYQPASRTICKAISDARADGPYSRIKLTTLTKEFFMPGFLERDEGERERETDRFAWDGVSGVRPCSGFAKTTTVGVY